MYRFFVKKDQIQEDAVIIIGSDVNHIKNVLRMKKGETILISDGEDREYVCTIDELENEQVRAKIEDVNGVAKELPIKVTLFQALPKGDKMETVIQKMIELGAYRQRESYRQEPCPPICRSPSSTRAPCRCPR